MADPRRVVTAAEMDLMSPNERAELVDERSTTDLESLTPELREQVEKQARELADELRAERTT